jgi:hypothetical protein
VGGREEKRREEEEGEEQLRDDDRCDQSVKIRSVLMMGMGWVKRRMERMETMGG